MEKLEWRKVAENNLYEAASTGLIRSKRRPGSKGGILKQFIVKGYLRVSLWENGHSKPKNVHRIIAETFIDNPYNKPCINHIDCNKLNNKVDNLEWCTIKENTVHAIKNGLIKPNMIGRSGYKSPRGVEVTQVTLNGEFVKKYGSLREASRETGISNASISLCINKKTKTGGGFIWRR